MTRRINFRLPDDLIEKADVAARVSHTNRTEVFKAALKEYLREVEDDEDFREELVERYLDDEIDYDTLRRFLGRQDAEAVRASKTILDQGETVAEELAALGGDGGG